MTDARCDTEASRRSHCEDGTACELPSQRDQLSRERQSQHAFENNEPEEYDLDMELGVEQAARPPDTMMENTGEEAPAPIPYTVFTDGQKRALIVLATWGGLISTISANVYFPAIPSISDDLGVPISRVNLTVTTYMIFQAISPMLWASMTESLGRRPVYVMTVTVYICANIGLALSTNYTQLIVLRCLQSTGSASTIAIGAGVLGDITTRKERGGLMGWFNGGLTLGGNALGPIAGGLIGQTHGWHSIFWFLVALSGTFCTTVAVFLPETLRKLVGNGSIPATGLNKPLVRVLGPPKALLQRPGTYTATRPRFRLDFSGVLLLFTFPDVVLALTYMAYTYTCWQMATVSMSSLFRDEYGLSEIAIGLTYIANGFGCLVGAVSNGRVLDWEYRRQMEIYRHRLRGGHADEDNGSSSMPAASYAASISTQDMADFPLELVRWRSSIGWGIISTIALLFFGWSVDRHWSIAVPIICSFFLGAASTAIMSSTNTIFVDLFPDLSASSTASMNLSRALLGAAGTAVIQIVMDAITPGWTFTLWAAVSLLTLPIPVVLIRYGAAMRRRRKSKQSRK